MTLRTLVLNGSPRRDGNTMTLAGLFLDALGGEHEILHAYDLAVSPCTACGKCAQNGVCAFDSRPGDAMPRVREELLRADCVVVASPLHFTSLTAPLVALISRWQSYWPLRRPGARAPAPLSDKKRAGVLVATGGAEYKDMFDCARRVTLAGFNTLGMEMLGVLSVSGMDAEG